MIWIANDTGILARLRLSYVQDIHTWMRVGHNIASDQLSEPAHHLDSDRTAVLRRRIARHAESLTFDVSASSETEAGRDREAQLILDELKLVGTALTFSDQRLLFSVAELEI